MEFFGIPVNDEILSNPRARDVLAIGKQFIGSEVYEDLLHRLEKASLNERQTIQSFYEILAGLNIEFQNGCFEALVKKLSTHGGYQHVADRLKEGNENKTSSFGLSFTSVCNCPVLNLGISSDLV